MSLLQRRLAPARQVSIQRLPFHAGEIHLVNLTALVYSDFDFASALEFVVNYGRDNDTTAAVTGSISSTEPTWWLPPTGEG